MDNRNSLVNNDGNSSRPLFLTKAGAPFKSVESFSDWTNTVIKRVLGNKHASMNTLRHSFASYKVRMNPFMTPAEKTSLARDMGHSLLETMGYDFERNLNTTTATMSRTHEPDLQHQKA